MWFQDAREAIRQGRDVCRAAWGFDTWLREQPGDRLIAVSISGAVVSTNVMFTWQDVCATDWAARTALRLVHSVTEHPAWEHVQQLFVGRLSELRGLDVRNLNQGMSMWLQEVQVECCRCGHPIRPFRQRRGDSWENLFFSPACPNDINPGCSRGRECRDEIDRIRAHVRGEPDPGGATQLGLF